MVVLCIWDYCGLKFIAMDIQFGNCSCNYFKGFKEIEGAKIAVIYKPKALLLHNHGTLGFHRWNWLPL